MTRRWVISIAALASLAIACLVWGSSAPRASEQAPVRVAGAADDDVATAKDGGETESTSPQGGADDGEAAAPAADADAAQTEPSGEAAESKDAAPAAKPAAAASDAASPEKAGKDVEAQPESKDEENSKQASLESDAAAEKVKSGDIAVPTDKVALAAFKMLEKNCSRCHQDGKLVNRPRPAKNFGNILDLAQLARDPSLIQPGNPDASRIYKQIVKKEMPYDTYYEFSGTEPTAEEVTALRDWIESLGRRRRQAAKPTSS